MSAKFLQTNYGSDHNGPYSGSVSRRMLPFFGLCIMLWIHIFSPRIGLIKNIRVRWKHVDRESNHNNNNCLKDLLFYKCFSISGFTSSIKECANPITKINYMLENDMMAKLKWAWVRIKSPPISNKEIVRVLKQIPILLLPRHLMASFILRPICTPKVSGTSLYFLFYIWMIFC